MFSNSNIFRKMEALFGQKFWDNVVLEFTCWPFDRNSIMQRNRAGKDEKWRLETFNEAIQEIFHINKTLDGVFIDSYSQQVWNLEDEGQQAAYRRETTKLWNIMKEKEAFQFMTLEKVLGELEFLRHENDRLNKIIEDDIEEIKESLEEIRYDVKANIQDIEGIFKDVLVNQMSISSNNLNIQNVSSGKIVDIAT